MDTGYDSLLNVYNLSEQGYDVVVGVKSKDPKIEDRKI